MNRWLTLALLMAAAEAGVANDSAWPPGNSAAETSPGKATSAPRAPAGPDLASAKLRSFNQDDYDLAFAAFMGSGDLKRAYLLASKAVQSVPTDVTWRQRLASVAEWVGNPLVAWENWAYLFQQGVRSDEVINGVVRLAPYVGQPDVAIEAWEYRAARTPLSSAQWADIRFLYEAVGKPQQGRRFFEAQYQKRHDGRLLEHAAALAENAGEDEQALRLYLERARLKPFSTEATLRAAVLLLRRDREREAYALLLAHSNDVPEATGNDEDAEEFWRLLGNTAWELMENDAAEMAYRRYVPSPSATAGDWGRLIYLVRQRHPGVAADLSFEAYRRYGNIENLLQALSIFAEAGDAKGEARLYQQLKVQELEGLERDARFLVLRAQHFQRVAEPEKSWDDYRRALAINPFDPQVATPALWFLIDAGRRKELEALLGVLRATAHKDAAYWLPFAAANLVLDQPQKALVWYRKEVRRNPDDILLLLNYAEVLQRVQQAGMAARVRQHAWLRLRERQATLAAPDKQPELLALTQLALLNRPGDPALALVRQVAGRLRGVPAAQEDAAQTRDLILGWAVATEQQANARQWLWLNYARQAGQPGRTPPLMLQSQMALQAGDGQAMKSLLADHADRLPLSNRYDMAAALGDHAQAESAAFAAMQGNDDDADMHERYRQQVPLRANYLQFRYAKNQYGDLDVRSRQMEARLALGVGRQLLLGWAENSQASAEPVLASYVPASERLTSLGMRWQREQGETQVHVFQRDERDRNTGLRFAQTWFWGRRLALDGTLGWRANSSDSLPLRVVGSEDHVQLGFNYALGRREYVRMAARVARYQTQSGDSLGTGRVHEFEVGHRIRTEYPDFRVRLFGMQQSYAYDDNMDDRTRELSPAVRAAVAAGTVDPMKYFLPQGSTTWGACLGLGENRAGQSVQEVYSRAFKPFFETCSTSNSLNGGGYVGVLGIAGTVTGEDHLSLRIEQSSGGAGTGALTRVLALRYRHYF